MDKKHINLIVSFLKDYSDIRANQSCDDWSFPDDWTQEEVNKFVGLFTYVNCPSNPNGDGENYDHWAKDRFMPGNCALAVIEHLLMKELDK